jgi:hypothetical protein
LWSEVDVTAPGGGNAEWRLSGFARERDPGANPALVGFGIAWTAHDDAWSFAAGAIVARIRPPRGESRDVRLPWLSVGRTAHVGNVDVAVGSRLEPVLGAAGDRWRARTIVTVSCPLGAAVRFSATDERFHDVTRGGPGRHRRLIGPVLTLANDRRVSVGYVDQRDPAPAVPRIRGLYLTISLPWRSTGERG